MKRKQTPIIAVTANNVAETGFFCYMSKRKTEGYRKKLEWLQARFAEGMRIKMLALPARGFIEYIPGEYAWRAVNANEYMFIHCLWIVGRSKGNGYGTLLLDECIKDAKQAGMNGVAMVTSEGNWLVGKRFLLQHGFEIVDHAPPSFELLVKRFGKASAPSFTGDWGDKLRRCSRGLTIFHSAQCPYLDAAVTAAIQAASEVGVQSQVIELKDARQVRELSPSAYGVYEAIYDGKLLTYHSLGKSELLKRIAELR